MFGGFFCCCFCREVRQSQVTGGTEFPGPELAMV